MSPTSKEVCETLEQVPFLSTPSVILVDLLASLNDFLNFARMTENELAFIGQIFAIAEIEIN